ncbi:MAG: DNA polymerase I [Clostridia bacterium]|nr:DNA polymerase I [Clostridia bacterium]MDD4387473.1 DNA polymerase I [Clostridia bacterium]
MKKFLIIDGNSIMNRAFYGISTRTMMTADGIATNALYGFLNIYWMIENMITPDYTAVSFDLRAPTFRHLLYSDYKGTRKGMPDELRPQMIVIKEILTAMNVPIIELETFEADDILGTVAKIDESNDIFTYILTGDKDSFQLISDKTSVIIPTTKMGKTGYTIYTPEVLKEKLNIDPYQIVDIKSLMGDSSDNIPGVKGIGEKTAYTLIEKYKTLEDIYKSIDTLEVSDKIREKLASDKEMAILSYKLATIDKDVPIIIDYDKCKKSDVNFKDLYKIFKRLNFNKFLTKFNFSDVSESIDVSTNNIFNDVTAEITKISDVIYIDKSNISILDNVLSKNSISYYLNICNVEYITNILKLNNDFLIIYCDNKIYTAKLDDNEFNFNILNKFAKSTCKKYGYNIKQDLRYLFDLGIIDVNNFVFDIMIAYYLMDSNKSSYLFQNIIGELFSVSFKEDEIKAMQMSLFEEPSNEVNKVLNYLSENNIYNLNIYLKAVHYSYDIVIDKIKKLDMLELFENIEIPLIETLANMEHTGMYIDLAKLNIFNEEITSKIAILEKSIYNQAECEFNINSPKQLGEILFDKLHLPSVRKNKTGYSTDKEVLEELEDKHEIVPMILEYRQLAKLKSTYVDGLSSKIASDGRIHTTFMQTVASTGRLSSTEPNLQNIPIRLELGSKIRSFFIGENDNMLIDSDYSQIELRVLADMSNDDTMINAFKSGEDIHKVTASQVFGVSLEEVNHTMRSNAKAVNFGIVYGISEFGLAKNIGINRVEAGLYIKNYLDKYYGVKSFMENTIKEAKEKGYVSTLYGRRRYIIEINSSNKNIAKFGERIAMNTPVQGTAADIIKIAMNIIYKKLKENNLKSRLIMQVHDELIIEVNKEEIEIVTNIMRNAMENVTTLKVPLNVDLHIAKNWYDAK